MQKDLPSGWFNVRLGDVLNLKYGKGLVKLDRDSTGKIPVFGSSGIVGYHFEPLITVPCLIIGRKGSVGKVYFSKTPCWPIDTTYYVFPNPIFDIDFLYYLLSSIRLTRYDTSTAVPSLIRKEVHDIIIRVLPMNEQKRIVSKIKKLFSQLEINKKALQKVKHHLVKYRYSLLQYTFDGKFNRTILTKNQNPLEFVTFGSLVEKSQLGLVRSIIQQKEYGGTLYLKMNNITSDGQISLEKIVYVDVSQEDLKKFNLCKGDLLFNTRNSFELVGKTAVWNNELQPVVFNNNIMRIQFKKGIQSKFINYYMMSNIFRDSLRSSKKATTNVCAIYQKDLFSKLIPIVSEKDQNRIVSFLDNNFSLILKNEKLMDQLLTQIPKLQSTIFKKTFEGKLVSQDPNDEPAKLLLEKIKNAN